jgi:DNA-directed RNA polymerase specialized sigma54-like protein
MLAERNDLPPNIHRFIDGFDGDLPEDEFNSPQFAYRVLFVAKTANNKGQADQVIEFIKADSDIAQTVNRKYAFIKETERKKFLPAQFVKMLQEEGYKRFSMNDHTLLWKERNAKNPKETLGVQIIKQWYWYDRWLDAVRDHCKGNAEQYR